MVRCRVCGKKFQQITNTHLDTHVDTHGIINVEKYREMYPEAPTHSKRLLKHMSQVMIGKNIGNERMDARDRMNTDNPMKHRKIARKMGRSRQKGIVEGRIQAIRNFDHLPTPNEKILIRWFHKWGLPLKYVGDGQFQIDQYCPDFLDAENKIVLELELSFTERPRSELNDKELTYRRAGYRTIWVTSMDKKYVRKWVRSFYDTGLKEDRIVRIWRERINPKGKKKVYNLEVWPNNSYIANRIVVHNCFADSFRASLYTSFFDNSRDMGLRHCDPDKFKRELDKLLLSRDKDPHDVKNPVAKAIAMKIPMRFGIRFEDFLKEDEGKAGISLELLNYLADQKYPVMVNTKSALIGEDPYVEALAKNLSAVHITLISSNDKILQALEPGAPTYKERLDAMRKLSQANVRVVARIEPFLVFITDHREDVERYIEDVHDAGVRYITFDTYSYTAKNPGIPQAFRNAGFDWERCFLAGCDSQAIGSLLLGAFMSLFREKGFHCSTFDMGNVPTNHDAICCNVGSLFKGFNYGSSVMAARLIKVRKPLETTWKDFRDYVEVNGGFLSPALEQEVKHLWNMEGNDAYSQGWAAGIVPVGLDRDGIVWRYDSTKDFRKDIFSGVSESSYPIG